MPYVDPATNPCGRAADLLAPCRRLLVLTGAGSSADAGIPTFRGPGGLWNDRKVEELASAAGFAADPEAVWDWYRARRIQAGMAQPHPGQRAIALLHRHFPAAQVLVVTTNEDDLLERAGVTEVLHLHGSFFETRCSALCGWRDQDRDSVLSRQPCPRCGARVRPGSVWFGEPLPSFPLERIAAFDADGCLMVGSACLVAPAAGIPTQLAEAGHPVVEVNTSETPFSLIASAVLRGCAKDLLPPLVDLLTSSTVRDQRLRQGG